MGLLAFSKAELRFPILFVLPPLVHCSSSSIIFHPGKSLLGGRHFYSELFSEFLAILDYALPVTEFYRRNDEYRIGGASRYFNSFSNSFGVSSGLILKKSLIFMISPIFFHLYRAEYGDGDRSSEEHLRNSKTTRDAYFGLDQSIHVKNTVAQFIW
jgi:hypothetical protein